MEKVKALSEKWGISLSKVVRRVLEEYDCDAAQVESDRTDTEKPSSSPDSPSPEPLTQDAETASDNGYETRADLLRKQAAAIFKESRKPT